MLEVEVLERGQVWLSQRCVERLRREGGEKLQRPYTYILICSYTSFSGSAPRELMLLSPQLLPGIPLLLRPICPACGRRGSPWMRPAYGTWDPSWRTHSTFCGPTALAPSDTMPAVGLSPAPALGPHQLAHLQLQLPVLPGQGQIQLSCTPEEVGQCSRTSTASAQTWWSVASCRGEACWVGERSRRMQCWEGGRRSNVLLAMRSIETETGDEQRPLRMPHGSLPGIGRSSSARLLTGGSVMWLVILMEN